jgi:hypothetical protein
MGREAGTHTPTHLELPMVRPLEGTKIAILATDGVDGALCGAGTRTELLSLHPGEIQARAFDLVSAGTLPVDRLVAAICHGPWTLHFAAARVAGAP